MIVFHESPCTKVCKLDETGMCIGCYRTVDEINNWSFKEEKERLEIFKRCEERKSIKNEKI